MLSQIVKQQFTATTIKWFLWLQLLCYFTSNAQQFNWVRSIGGTTSTSFQVDMDKVDDLAIDKWGNSYVVGKTSANPKVNGTSITSGNYGLQDGYVGKFDRCGNLEWMRIMGKNQSDLTSGVAVDDAGNCYVTGWVSQGQFTSPCKDTSFPVNSLNSFIAKYDGSGCMKWIRVLDGIGAYPKPRNIKMRSDGKLCVWMNCQPKPAPVIDSIVITFYTNLFMRMDTNGVIEYHKFVDAGSTNLSSFQLEKNNNLCLYYSHGDGFNPTNYSIAGQTFALDIDGSLILRLDNNFEYLSHEQNYKAQILGYEEYNGKLYTHAILQKGAYFGEDTFTTIKARFNYQEVFRSSDLNFQKLALSQPDTQRNAQIGTQDLCISGDYVYLTLTNSAGFMKWSNIDLLNFGTMVPTIGVLVRFNKHTLEGELLDTIYGYRGVSGFDIVNVMERDRQGNIYMAGLFAGALYLGDTVTPNGGGGSPDGFLTRWGLPCTDTTDALIAPVQPLNLIASAATQQINVQWQDAAQYELGYELYRSIGDTLQWVKTDSLPRNTQNKTDGSVQENIVYWYKVRAFNTGGFSAWSNADSAMIVKEDTTVAIGIEEVKTIKYLEVYPNPANDKVTAGIYTESATSGTIRLLSLEGRAYINRSLQLNAGMHRETIDTKELSAGVYLIEVQAGNSRMVQRLVVMR